MTKEKKQFAYRPKQMRYFSTEFKKEKVKDLQAGKLTVSELATLYQVSRTSIYKWLYLYSSIEKGVTTVVQMESEETKVKELMQRIKELEASVGRKQLEIEYLNKLYEISSDEVGYNLKKRAVQKLWNGSGRNPKQ